MRRPVSSGGGAGAALGVRCPALARRRARSRLTWPAPGRSCDTSQRGGVPERVRSLFERPSGDPIRLSGATAPLLLNLLWPLGLTNRAAFNARSPLAGAAANGWTDWFYTWSRDLAGSALHKAVVAGPAGSRFVDPSTLPASSARAPLGRPAEHNAAAS